MNPAAPPPPYLAALAASANKPPGAPPGNPGGPPPPTGVGAMNTGSPGTTPREAASALIMAIREYQKHYPGAAPQAEGWVAQVIQSAKPQGAPIAPAPGGPPGGAPPPPPGAGPGPMPPVPSLDDGPPGA